jgi:tripartite-type tricarboxylate transporter receptor subunit TctC
VESGIPEIDALAWWGMVAPTGTPDAVIRRFNAAMAEALEKQELRERLASPLGIEAVASTPEIFGEFLNAQIETWGRVIRQHNIKPD